MNLYRKISEKKVNKGTGEIEETVEYSFSMLAVIGIGLFAVLVVQFISRFFIN